MLEARRDEAMGDAFSEKYRELVKAWDEAKGAAAIASQERSTYDTEENREAVSRAWDRELASKVEVENHVKQYGLPPVESR